MRSVKCEVCQRSIELTTNDLAGAALDQRTEFHCPGCGSIQEIAYCREGLIHATTGAPGRMIKFTACGAMTITQARLETR